jgi:hypothetical protein
MSLYGQQTLSFSPAWTLGGTQITSRHYAQSADGTAVQWDLAGDHHDVGRVIKEGKMSDIEQTKKPGGWQTLAAGMATGLLAWVLFFSIADGPPTSIRQIREMFAGDAPTYFFYVLLACVAGAFIGRSTGRSFKTVWKGAFIALMISVILMLAMVFLLCCQ